MEVTIYFLLSFLPILAAFIFLLYSTGSSPSMANLISSQDCFAILEMELLNTNIIEDIKLKFGFNYSSMITSPQKRTHVNTFENEKMVSKKKEKSNRTELSKKYLNSCDFGLEIIRSINRIIKKRHQFVNLSTVKKEKKYFKKAEKKSFHGFQPTRLPPIYEEACY